MAAAAAAAAPTSAAAAPGWKAGSISETDRPQTVIVCADVETVGWRPFEGEGGEDSSKWRWAGSLLIKTKYYNVETWVRVVCIDETPTTYLEGHVHAVVVVFDHTVAGGLHAATQWLESTSQRFDDGVDGESDQVFVCYADGGRATVAGVCNREEDGGDGSGGALFDEWVDLCVGCGFELVLSEECCKLVYGDDSEEVCGAARVMEALCCSRWPGGGGGTPEIPNMGGVAVEVGEDNEALSGSGSSSSEDGEDEDVDFGDMLRLARSVRDQGAGMTNESRREFASSVMERLAKQLGIDDDSD